MKKLILSFSLVLMLSACAMPAPMSPIERRAMQTRTFRDTSYENVFYSFKTILQDDGYIIKNQDMSGGLIMATIEQADSSSEWSHWSGSSGKSDSNYRTSYVYEVSVNLEKINEGTTDTRITIQQIDQYSLGGREGHEVLDGQSYRTIYNKVQSEIERRKGQGKG